ncbi:MAG: hypothetical protein ACPKM0_02265 [Pleomorphochaeta sp.]
MKKKGKTVFIVFIGIITLLFLLVEAVYLTRKPIYFICDSIYYDKTINYQKTKLKYNFLINNHRIIFVVDEFNDGQWIDKDYEKDSIIIVSPYISMLMEYDKDILFEDNYLVSIDNNLERANLNIAVDYLTGFEKLALALKKENKNIYLISSKAWPTSVSKASAFSTIYSDEGLTKIELEGNELEQKAYEIVNKINKEENVEVVSTGNTLISYFNRVENNIVYNFEAYQSNCVETNDLHYVIYEDLIPLVNLENSENIVLSTDLKNHQEGVINFFLHLLRDLQSLLF